MAYHPQSWIKIWLTNKNGYSKERRVITSSIKHLVINWTAEYIFHSLLYRSHDNQHFLIESLLNKCSIVGLGNKVSATKLWISFSSSVWPGLLASFTLVQALSACAFNWAFSYLNVSSRTSKSSFEILILCWNIFKNEFVEHIFTKEIFLEHGVFQCCWKEILYSC